MSFELTQNLSTVFAAAGYEDLDFSDVITARREDGKTWEVIVDRGGQMRATVTYRGSKPQEKFVPVLDRNMSVMTEKRTVITAFFTLNDTDELAQALQALDDAIAPHKDP